MFSKCVCSQLIQQPPDTTRHKPYSPWKAADLAARRPSSRVMARKKKLHIACGKTELLTPPTAAALRFSSVSAI